MRQWRRAFLHALNMILPERIQNWLGNKFHTPMKTAQQRITPCQKKGRVMVSYPANKIGQTAAPAVRPAVQQFRQVVDSK
jgi:hypothetical protein